VAGLPDYRQISFDPKSDRISVDQLMNLGKRRPVDFYDDKLKQILVKQGCVTMSRRRAREPSPAFLAFSTVPRSERFAMILGLSTRVSTL